MEIFSFFQNLQFLTFGQNLTQGNPENQGSEVTEPGVFESFMAEFKAQEDAQSEVPEIVDAHKAETVRAFRPVVKTPEPVRNFTKVETETEAPRAPVASASWKNLFVDNRRAVDVPLAKEPIVPEDFDFDEGVFAETEEIPQPEVLPKVQNTPSQSEVEVIDEKPEELPEVPSQPKVNEAKSEDPEIKESKEIDDVKEPVERPKVSPEIEEPEDVEQKPAPVEPSKIEQPEAKRPVPEVPETERPEVSEVPKNETPAEAPDVPDVPEQEAIKPSEPSRPEVVENAPVVVEKDKDGKEEEPDVKKLPETPREVRDVEVDVEVDEKPEIDTKLKQPETVEQEPELKESEAREPEAKKPQELPELPEVEVVDGGVVRETEPEKIEKAVEPKVIEPEKTQEPVETVEPRKTETPIEPVESKETERPVEVVDPVETPKTSKTLETPEPPEAPEVPETPERPVEAVEHVEASEVPDVPEKPEEPVKAEKLEKPVETREVHETREAPEAAVVMAGFAAVHTVQNSPQAPAAPDVPASEAPDVSRPSRPERSRSTTTGVIRVNSHEDTPLSASRQPSPLKEGGLEETLPPLLRGGASRSEAEGSEKESPKPNSDTETPVKDKQVSASTTDSRTVTTRTSASRTTEKTETRRADVHSDFQSFFDGITRTRRTSSTARVNTQPLSLRTSTYTEQPQGSTLRNGIVNVVRFIRSDGVRKANIIVDPPALGRISVELTQSSSGVEASIKVASEQIRQILQDQVTQLRDNLLQQGVQVSEFTVDVQQDNSRQGQNSGDGNQQSQYDFTAGNTEDEDTEDFRVDLEEGLLYWVA